MFAVMVTFRDEYGRESLGELVDPFKIIVFGLDEEIHVDAALDSVSVATTDGETDMIHQIPWLAVIDMKEIPVSV